MANKKGKWRVRISMEDYLVMSAIRGPDSEDLNAYHLKRITAGVVRWFAGLHPDLGPTVISPLDAKRSWVELCMLTRVSVGEYASKEVHYTNHFMDAMKVFADREYSGAKEYLAWFEREVLR